MVKGLTETSISWGISDPPTAAIRIEFTAGLCSFDVINIIVHAGGRKNKTQSDENTQCLDMLALTMTKLIWTSTYCMHDAGHVTFYCFPV